MRWWKLKTSHNRGHRTVLSPADLRRLVFGQQHVGTQQFFAELAGTSYTVPLEAFPHTTFLKEQLDRPLDDDTAYAEYLRQSWDYYYGPEKNTPELRLARAQEFVELFRHINRQGAVRRPVQVYERRDGHLVILDGNHRAAIALALELPLEADVMPIPQALAGIATNPGEFYGSKHADMPYQSIFDGEVELVRGRRPDVLERIRMLDPGDLAGASILELGCNIGVNSFLAAQHGAASVRGLELSPRIATAAIRLNSYFALPCRFQVADLNLPVAGMEPCDTVLCFSVVAHLAETAAITQTIRQLTRRVLYFEGHAGTQLGADEYVLNKDLFASIELAGYGSDGVHTDQRTRPLFRCEAYSSGSG
jgi:2-polyprenyl-3-methyl-5-hydroxy-6-metoxy-1,4-benzoquinol methylase